ncbi:hypothetical protein [Cytobacillus gottheilii]|uniref:hypothetical protein n=1 Tax=Cytobacillus gottheilii TaxID=859144 RepID=UPI0009B954F0|nr:hypothetical protein [Cytobacillus gottheilii]
MELDMKVEPRFVDHECAIIFSFYFRNASLKVGEAVIYTCEEDIPSLDQLLAGVENSEQDTCKKKIAYITEMTIVDNYRDESFMKINEFLSIIGINTWYKENLPIGKS